MPWGYLAYEMERLIFDATFHYTKERKISARGHVPMCCTKKFWTTHLNLIPWVGLLTGLDWLSVT
jgi:hypothetical protein